MIDLTTQKPPPSAEASANDALRMTGHGGITLVTDSIARLAPDTGRRIYAAIAKPIDFVLESDPFGRHDRGSTEVDGRIVLWSISLVPLRTGSRPIRVMTIMLLDDY